MNDMSTTIVAKSDQINAADLIGTPRTVVIKEVRIKAGDDQPVSVLIEGDAKAFRPCKGVRRLMVRVWGADASKYIGQAMTLFCDPSVTWAGKEEGGIRVSHMTGLDEAIVEYMRTSRAATKAYKIFPLAKATPALTLEQARADIEFATDLDELKAVWTRKAMVPFHAKLKVDLDARKAALTAPNDGTLSPENPTATEGRDDTDHGEAMPYVAIVDELLERIASATLIADVIAAERDFAAHRDAVPDEVAARVDQAVAEKRAALKVGR